MKRVLFLAVCFSLVLPVFGATKDDPSVTVTGEAAMRVPADRAYIVLYSQEEDNNAETAISESYENVERAMAAAKRKSTKKISYVVVNTGIAEVMASVQVDSGTEYLGAHCIRVSCSPDDEDIFALIDDATKVYISITPHASVSSSLPFSPIIYAVEDYAKAEETLENQALADAKARAEKLAQKAGKTLGEILSIQSGLIPAEGRDLDLPTPYISGNRTGVMMYQTVTVSYQLIP